MTPPPSPDAGTLPDALAGRIDAAMDRVRALVAHDAPDRPTLERIRSVLAEVAAETALFPTGAFAPDPASRDAIYLLSEDPDRRLALYLAVRDAPLETPVHDHTTWAVIVGVRGLERNRFFARRPDGGGLEESGRADVLPGGGVALLAPDLHAIATDAGVLNMQLHLYGRSFDAQTGRVTVDVATGAERPFVAHPDIRVPAGRITAATLRRMTLDGGELAVVDLREVAAHAERGHPLVAACVPAGRLVAEAPVRFPNRHARIVLLDDDGLGPAAQRALQDAGYRSVHRLPGGSRAWADAGYRLFTGLNVPGKAFGEFVDHHGAPPVIDAPTLAARRRAGDPAVLIDCRTPAEHHRMTLPGSLNIPGAELPARIRAVVPDPSTPVVIHCAGRTRGIVAARMLIDAGCPNPVTVLENGLIGWLLAGERLELAGGRPMPEALAPLPDPGPGVAAIDAATLAGWLDDPARTTYVFDVRSAAEFAAGHHPAARHLPGGELLQQLEASVPVRHARVVIAGDDLRARTIARWLARMDWAEPAVLAGPFGTVAGAPLTPPAMPRGWRPPFDEHDQDPARMQGYIDWELTLNAELAEDATLAFRWDPPTASTRSPAP